LCNGGAVAAATGCGRQTSTAQNNKNQGVSRVSVNFGLMGLLLVSHF